MTISAQEQQVRLQFLEEAQDYVDQMESGLLGLGSGDVKGKQLDAVMRAAHSIKGGAAMMNFMTLSKIGHRLEDSLKVLRYGQKVVDGKLEKDMLAVVDRMRLVMDYNQRGVDIPEKWLQEEVEPLLASLLERLGEPQAADEASFLSDEEGGEDDILTYLFETEVDTALEHLEEILTDPAYPSLRSELEITTETLNGLAEMVELPEMAKLCVDISEKLISYPDRFIEIAELAVTAWRRSQSLVLVGMRDNLPTAIELSGVAATVRPVAQPAQVEIEFPVTTDEIISDRNLLEDLLLADTLVPVETSAELEIFNLEPAEEAVFSNLFDSSNLFDFSGDLALESLEPSSNQHSYSFEPLIENLFSLDELMPGLEPMMDLSESGSLPIGATLDDIDVNSLDQLKDHNLDPDVVDTLPSLVEQPVMDWLDTSAPQGGIDADDFFGAISALSAEISEPTGQLDAVTNASKNSDLLADFSVLEEDEPTAALLEPAASEPVVPEQMVRIGMNQLAEIGDLFGEINIGRSGLNLQIDGIRSLLGGLLEKVGNLEQASSQLRNAYDQISVQVQGGSGNSPEIQEPNPLANDFDLLEMDRYGEFHLLSQSVIETVVQIQEKVTDIELRLNETEMVTRDIDRTTKQMQNHITSVRMLPFHEVVGRFPRALREMSAQYGKEVELKIVGGNLLIERNVLDILKDPLMHILRNCFDHGLETPTERLLANKPALGVIEIKAFYRGNQTVITIQDDGRGINLDKIRAKALKMGIDEQTLSAAGEKELLDLLFEPGFSTAEQVTDLSGRGVGMDVVRTNLQEAKGNIQINTKFGQGSLFTITVPFNLSVIKVMIVEADKLLFAVPVNVVEEMLIPDFDTVVTRDGEQFLEWEEFQVKLIKMQECFHSYSAIGSPDFNGIPKIDQPALLLVSQAEKLVGLQIDRFWQEQEVTVRQPQSAIDMPAGLSGCAILGDGRILPLLDPLALLRSLDEQNVLTDVDAPPVESMLSNVAKEDVVMVVDDSINVRRFVALTLERNGYRVEQAKDGLEALEKVQAGLIPSAVICDLEMPRMDGYGFLANVKAIDFAKHVPVVMLTSRSGQKHRKLAMNLGAADYFAKPFNEADMLATLKKLIAADRN
jgi:two-component system, chemotaxis family, sensor histidine kinase and response regulator PixL